MNGSLILAQASEGSAGGSILMIVLYLAFFIGLMYFLMIRPQKKQAKKAEELQNSLEPGDTIMTTSGFFGTIIDVQEDAVIVEFGNNKNCRIPMHKRAIAEVEKAGTAEIKEDNDTAQEEPKKLEAKEEKKKSDAKEEKDSKKK